MGNDKHAHFKIKIAVSGAAETEHCGEGALDASAELGREVARQGAILVSGATTGIPFWAAKGAKEAGGISVGLSPAGSEREHVEHYKLPLDYMDLIIYTGFGFSGRDILMTRSSDAVLFGCGRVGTIHEFTVAFEDDKPMGVLTGPWSTDEVIKDIMEKGHRTTDKIVFESDPKILIQKVLEMVKKDKQEYYKVYNNGDHFSDLCDGKTCQVAL
ncbi:MAG TPA: hypothetical protein VJJ24_02840 [Candidatus Paceibacterota bacterium]